MNSDWNISLNKQSKRKMLDKHEALLKIDKNGSFKEKKAGEKFHKPENISRIAVGSFAYMLRYLLYTMV